MAFLPVAKTRETALRFLQFVNATGSPFHSVAAARVLLEAAGFQRVSETGLASGVKRGGKFYVTRNHATLMAFIVGKKFQVDSSHGQTQPTGGFILAGSHTDSPCLRVRPVESNQEENYEMLNVETYGGGLWHTWFDRGLGLAGKVVVRKKREPVTSVSSTATPLKNGEAMSLGVEERLVRISQPLLYIPNLAIHLQSGEERKNFSPSPELHLRPVWALTTSQGDSGGAQSSLLKQLLAQELGCGGTAEDILTWDLSLMDATEGQLCGLNGEFIQSARLDNLASVWATVDALCALPDSCIENSSDIFAVVAFDHEEVGSVSFTGANSELCIAWMHEILAAGLKEPESSAEAGNAQGGAGLRKGVSTHDVLSLFSSVARTSLLLSVDGAHGVHPNYAAKHQAKHKPHLSQGIVVKESANQRYTTEATSAAWIQLLAERCQPDPCPIQPFNVRNDSPCGSTIGPTLAAASGFRSVDIGLPQLGMHSIRELCASVDLLHLRNLVMSAFLNFRHLDTASCYV